MHVASDVRKGRRCHCEGLWRFRSQTSRGADPRRRIPPAPDGLELLDRGKLTDRQAPFALDLPTHTASSIWRGIKVFADHAFIVSEAGSHGMQVFDLTALRSVAAPPVTFTATAHYSGVGSVHTIAVNEASGFVYLAGSKTTWTRSTRARARRSTTTCTSAATTPSRPTTGAACA
jgi:choice-of-anchor B domain-containing protein